MLVCPAPSFSFFHSMEPAFDFYHRRERSFNRESRQLLIERDIARTKTEEILQLLEDAANVNDKGEPYYYSQQARNRAKGLFLSLRLFAAWTIVCFCLVTFVDLGMPPQAVPIVYLIFGASAVFLCLLMLSCHLIATRLKKGSE
jgi:Flp pilus assembly protein TadB